VSDIITLARKHNLIIVQDTREQSPYFLDDCGLAIREQALKTGDYSIVGFESRICVERKTLSDYCGCIFTDRFQRELERMAEMVHTAIIIEGLIEDIGTERCRSQAHLNAIIGKMMADSVRYRVHIMNFPTKAICVQAALRFMLQAWLLETPRK